MTRSYRDIELDVIRWAEARKIIPNSTPVAQARKALEEVGELIHAAALIEATDEYGAWCNSARREFKDAIGDTVVCLINACALADVDLVECLEGAYETIKDRKGTLRPNGVFVKESA